MIEMNLDVASLKNEKMAEFIGIMLGDGSHGSI
jgi:hypothetical protein